MSESAFGIEHGEFSKGLTLPGGTLNAVESIKHIGTQTGLKTSSLGTKIATGTGAGGGKRVAGPAMGSMRQKVGDKLTTYGNKMAVNPGKTGLGVVGAGGLGAAGVGHHMFSNKNR